MTKKLIPVVKVKAKKYKSMWILTFWCPFCKRNHHHSGGKITDDYKKALGHRVDHCGDPRSPFKETGYVLR